LLPSNTLIPPPPVIGQPPHPLLVQLCKEPKFTNLILDDLTRFAKMDRLRGFEFVKAIKVQADMFTADNGLLTPTFKLKRADAAKIFRPSIDAMYKDLDSKRSPAKL
jgi:long-chain acyl-CoA synthetase